MAASRWIEELRARPTPAAAQMLKTAPTYRDLTPTQYQVAHDWLVSVGLLTQGGYPIGSPSQSAAELILVTALSDSAPIWLPDADNLVIDKNDLPIDFLDVAESLGVTGERALALVRSAWKKFDEANRAAIGLAGELVFLGWTRERVHVRLTHVSLYDDMAGYDIVAESNSVVTHVEVKSTTRQGRTSIYLSRNEHDVMTRSELWCLQVVLLDQQHRLRDVYWVDNAILRSAAPFDRDTGRWQSVRIDLKAEDLRLGMAPQLMRHLG